MATLDVKAGSGSVTYNVSGNYGAEPPSGSGSDSGAEGGGTIWSDSSQIIWVQADSAPEYPIQLQPGNNDVHFWAPTILPKDEAVEAPIVIKAPGYILIPAGFEFSIKTGKNAPVIPPNENMMDALKFVDLYDIEITIPPIVIDPDGAIEDMIFEDIQSIDIESLIVIAEQSLIENISFSDITLTEIVSESISDTDEPENMGFEDFVDIDI